MTWLTVLSSVFIVVHPSLLGQKGIGFKSVFRITDQPEIHSNGFHMKFDATCGPNGYIVPQWIEDDWSKKDQNISCIGGKYTM